jgi:hypothetical protein
MDAPEYVNNAPADVAHVFGKLSEISAAFETCRSFPQQWKC